MKTAIALNRFGLGARPADAARVTGDPAGWLQDQLHHTPPPALPADPPQGLEPRTAPLLAELQRISRQPDSAPLVGRFQRERHVGDVQARVNAALLTEHPFTERLVHFWSNHFAVSADRRPMAVLAGPFENEAIRPRILGRFADLLLAVEQHPAMLLFLDQARSSGPRSLAAQRAAARGARAPGLNENLAREILELHTLGVQGGYRQTDVQELAQALTGWSVDGYGPRPRAEWVVGEFVFHPEFHEPGARRLLGRDYPEAGQAQARDMLLELARHPATARHVATRLACHFVADSPPPALVDRLAAVFQATDGDLPSVYRALIAHPAAWAQAHAKFKSPWDYAVSALRALGAREAAPRPEATVAVFADLGQRVWTPGSPAGFGDTAERWAAPDALLKRVEYSALLGRRAAGRDPRDLLERVLPGVVSESTRAEIARAESPAQGLALLFASAEFMRR